MPEWIEWKEGDPAPEPGEYWVTAPGLGGVAETFRDLLGNYDWRQWRYSGVRGYMPRQDCEDRPDPMKCDLPTGSSE